MEVITLISNGNAEKKVAFPRSFTGKPNVFTNLVTASPGQRTSSVKDVSANGFTIVVNNDMANVANVYVYWFAIK